MGSQCVQDRFIFRQSIDRVSGAVVRESRFSRGGNNMFRKVSTAALLMALSATALLVVAQDVAKDLDNAISEASNWVGWKPDDSMYPKEDGKKALEDGKTCIDKIDEALSKGLAAATMVETKKGGMTIGEGREMCVAVRAAGQKVLGDLTEAEKAQYDPFRKVLTGDKRGLYTARLKKYNAHLASLSNGH